MSKRKQEKDNDSSFFDEIDGIPGMPRDKENGSTLLLVLFSFLSKFAENNISKTSNKAMDREKELIQDCLYDVQETVSKTLIELGKHRELKKFRSRLVKARELVAESYDLLMIEDGESKRKELATILKLERVPTINHIKIGFQNSQDKEGDNRGPKSYANYILAIILKECTDWKPPRMKNWSASSVKNYIRGRARKSDPYRFASRILNPLGYSSGFFKKVMGIDHKILTSFAKNSKPDNSDI